MQRIEATETSTAGVSRMPSCSAATASTHSTTSGAGWSIR